MVVSYALPIFDLLKHTSMKKPVYTPGQSVEVEMHNSTTGKSEWKPGTIIAVVPAIDVPYRIEVQVGDYMLIGNSAAHPDCVKPAGPIEKAKAAVLALTVKGVQGRVSKQSAAFKTVMAAIENPGVEQACGKNQGSGNFAGSTSWANQVAAILMRAKITYQIFNVAPKGGRHGDRVVVNL